MTHQRFPRQLEEKVYQKEVAASHNNKTNKTLGRAVRDGDKRSIIEHFLPDVLKIAAKYVNPSDKERYADTVGVGNLTLAEWVMSHKPRFQTIQANILHTIEQGIRNYELSETVHCLHTKEDSKKLLVAEDPTMEKLEILAERAALREDLLEALLALGPKYAEAVKMRYGFDAAYGKKMAYREMGEILKVSGSRVNQMVRKVINSLRKPSRSARLAPYLEVFTCFARPTPLPRAEDRSVLERLQRDIQQHSGKTLDEFMRHYGLSSENFANFLTRIYSPLEKRDSLRIVRLSDAERTRLEEEETAVEDSFQDMGAIKRTLKHFEEQKKVISKARRMNLIDRLREAYMPLFATNRVSCLSLLLRESENPRNAGIMRELFGEIRRYFSQVNELEIGGVSTSLDDFQKVDVEVLSRSKAAIIASEMGTGKSLEAICYALRRNLQRVLVVSTKSGAYSTWPRELRRHLSGTPSIAVLDGQRFRDKELLKEASRARWFVTTYTTGARHIGDLVRMNFDLVILDESHKINNTHTTQSRALCRLNPPHKLAVSGSLFKNDRRELFAVLNWLFPTEFPDKQHFIKRYCADDRGLYRLQLELRKRMVLRFKEDVLRLPGVEHVHESVVMDESTARDYAQMEDNFIAWYERTKGSFSGDLIGHAIIAKLHGLRERAIQPKVPVIDDILEQCIAQDGRKAILYTTYLGTARAFQKRYKRYGVCYLDGTTPNAARVRSIEHFETNLRKKLFVVTAAGGESIDLTAGSDLIYANKPLTYADEKQMLDRLHRRGQTQSVRAFHVTTLDSIDERIEKLVSRKREEYKRVVHDSVHFAKWFEENESRNIAELLRSMMTVSGKK